MYVCVDVLFLLLGVRGGGGVVSCPFIQVNFTSFPMFAIYRDGVTDVSGSVVGEVACCVV